MTQLKSFGLPKKNLLKNLKEALYRNLKAPQVLTEVIVLRNSLSEKTRPVKPQNDPIKVTDSYSFFKMYTKTSGKDKVLH